MAAGANYRPPDAGLQAPGWGLPPWGSFDLRVWNCVTPQECAPPPPIFASQSVTLSEHLSFLQPGPLSPERESDLPSDVLGASGSAGSTSQDF